MYSRILTNIRHGWQRDVLATFAVAAMLTIEVAAVALPAQTGDTQDALRAAEPATAAMVARSEPLPTCTSLSVANC